MKIHSYIYLFFFFICFCCSENEEIPTADLTRELPLKDTIQLNIDYLKKNCQPGDLVVRLGGDLISDRIRYLSVKDNSYSHAGVVVMHNGEKMVCHIYPDDFVPGADTVRYDAIDSFLNKRTNLKCALYRYNLSENERITFEKELDKYHSNKVHFDKRYELNTDDKIYCSEMIYKALKKATASRIVIEQSNVPEKMRKLISIYFKKYNFTAKTINTRKIIAIDNLYENPGCNLVMKFPLKAMP